MQEACGWSLSIPHHFNATEEPFFVQVRARFDFHVWTHNTTCGGHQMFFYLIIQIIPNQSFEQNNHNRSVDPAHLNIHLMTGSNCNTPEHPNTGPMYTQQHRFACTNPKQPTGSHWPSKVRWVVVKNVPHEVNWRHSRAQEQNDKNTRQNNCSWLCKSAHCSVAPAISSRFCNVSMSIHMQLLAFSTSQHAHVRSTRQHR